MVADKKPKIEEVGEASYAFNWDDPLEKLQEVQEELDKVNRDAFKKVLEIEEKYNVMRKPIYEERTEIIRKIPYFWETTLANHPTIGDLISENDTKILMQLDSLIVDDFEDLRKGYSITFNFKPNPFFENKKLTKTIKFLNDGTTTATGTVIAWKAGQGPAEESGNVADGNKRALPKESFFNWFSDPRAEESKVEQDVVAESIVEDIWPNPVNMYLNQDEEVDDYTDEDDDEEEDTDDDYEFSFY